MCVSRKRLTTETPFEVRWNRFLECYKMHTAELAWWAKCDPLSDL